MLEGSPLLPAAAATNSPRAKKSPENISLYIFKSQIPRKLFGAKPFLMNWEDIDKIENQVVYINIYTWGLRM